MVQVLSHMELEPTLTLAEMKQVTSDIVTVVFYNPSVRCVTYAAWVNPPAKRGTFALLAGSQSGQSCYSPCMIWEVMHIRHFLLLFKNDSLGSNFALTAHKVLQISLLPFVISTLMIFRWFRAMLQKVWMTNRPFHCRYWGMFKKGDAIKKYSYKL